MSFWVYDLTFLAIFCIALVIFLYSRRKNLKREGPMYLYKTRVGIKFIDYVGKKYPGLLNFLSYFVIAFGYIAMIAMIYLLVETMKVFFIFPEFVRAVKIPPLAPLIPYLPQLFNASYLPAFYFTYWIISISLVAIVHEFSHGIFARRANIKIKSTGFAFLGPFIGAFVEPDERKMKKAKIKDQLTILAAGTFSNAVLCVLFLIIFLIFISLAYSSSGVIFNSYPYEQINKSSINSIGNNISINFSGVLNLTEVRVGNRTYYIYTKSIGELSNLSAPQIIAFDDGPALRAGISGVIIQINNDRIRNGQDLKSELLKYNPGENITIRTSTNGTEKDYNVTLGANPNNNTQAYLRGEIKQVESSSIMGRIRSVFILFRDPYTQYSPKIFPELTIFIYYLLWWIIFINFSVALVNMLPAWIFDGGRFFYLTIQGITGKENVAKIVYQIATYIILGIFALLMVLWAFSFIR
jgi:membrane-associated protease RseP (regulator of RpoE activity)